MLPKIKRAINVKQVKKVQVSKPKQREGNDPEFGDCRFDYIVACKHDISCYYCPVCQLIEKSVVEKLNAENERDFISYETSSIKRGELNLKLLRYWARNQLCSLCDLSCEATVEIALSSDVLNVLRITGDTDPCDFSFAECARLFERRKRITQIGTFAAIFIQSRLRKFLCRRRIRVELLCRFEYIRGRTDRERDIFVDTLMYKNRRRLPLILGDEKPGTPRTIERRLVNERKRQEARVANFLGAMVGLNGLNMLQSEDVRTRLIRQTAVLRDIIAAGMELMSRPLGQQYREISTAKSSSALPLQERLNDALELPRLVANIPVLMTGVVANERATGVDGVQNVPLTMATQFVPVLLAISAPGPSQRQLAISMALQTPPYQVSQLVLSRANARSRENKDKDKRVDASDGDVAAGALTAPNINKCLRELEQRAWDSLRCHSPEEVIAKLRSGSHRLLAAFDGVTELAGDSTDIWRGERAFKGAANAASSALLDFASSLTDKLPPIDGAFDESFTQESDGILGHQSRTPITDRERNTDSASRPTTNQSSRTPPRSSSSHRRSSSSNTNHEARGSPLGDNPTNAIQAGVSGAPTEVLPMSIQLRPVRGDFSPQCVFRLFFFEAELVAVTPLSPWTFYSEVVAEI
jgi:hypothetical protein